MGIKIVSQPIGSPIIAAASTAMAQANQRTAERQSKMWMQQVEHKYNTKAAEAERTWETQQNDFNFGRQNALRPMTPGLKGNLRAASDWAKLQDEARNIYGGLTIDPRSPEAQERLKQIAEDMGMLEEVNPDPTPAEIYDKNRVIVGPDGSTKKPDGTPYTATDPGAKSIIIDDSGRPIKDPNADAAEKATKAAEDAATKQMKEQLAKAQKQIADANAKTQKNYDLQRGRQVDAYKRKEKALLDKPGTTDEDVAKLWSEFDSAWPLDAPGLIPMPDTGAAPVPDVAGPAGGGLPAPGAPTAPPDPNDPWSGAGGLGAPVPASPGAPAPAPQATPGAATPEALGWDIIEWTPEEADIALDKIAAEMEKNGVKYADLDPATRARFDALVRQKNKGGV